MVLTTRLRLAVTATLLVLLLLLAYGAHAIEASPEGSPSGDVVQGGKLSLPGREPAFLMAVNYEGPADRAWQMWEDGQYDPGLIEADLRRAREAGFSTVRVFVQAPLAREIQAGRWDKLDGFFAMAARQGLAVILSLHDYEERDLSRVAEVAGKIATRYAGNSTLLAYDLRNEPHFSDLASAVYPGGKKAPVQENPGSLKSYQELVSKAGSWVTERDYLLSSLDYLDSPEGRTWDGLLGTVDASLAMWLQPQIDAIRRADKGHPITTSYSDLILARLPANGALDYLTVHRYPNASAKGIAAATRAVNNLRSRHGDKPVLLGEFGFSTASMSPEDSASYETALYLQLASEGLAGGAKWMLNDYPKGANAVQNAYGVYRADGSGKPVATAMRGLADYLARSPSRGGQLYIQGGSSGYRWAYEADDALIVSADDYRGTRLSFDAAGLSQLFLTWPEPARMRLYATTRTELDLDPGAVVRDPKMGGGFSLVRLDGEARTAAPFTQSGSRLKMTLEGGKSYELALTRSQSANPSRGLDYDIPGGHFFSQANGRPLGASAAGFAVTDEGGARFWSEFQRLGGVQALGYPATNRFVLDGFVTQAFQKAVLQWRPEAGRAYFLNTFDLMHDRGLDDWLLAYRQTPRPFDTSPDAGLAWDKVAERHLALLDQSPAIRERFLSNPAWLDHYGLPVSASDQGNSFVIRAQRATFQAWKEDVPWAKKGEVTVANGGDLAKEAGLWPQEATIPRTANGQLQGPVGPVAGHDWRSPGYVSAVGGQIYDPRGVLFRSAGTNVPDLPFRGGLEENLEWMRQHNHRWMRVFATGHDLDPARAPRDATSAIAALGSMLSRVDAFNAVHAPSEAIYVLVSLTDYYPPGVPGDRYGYDHPTFRLSPVLPAPWYRAGVRSFDFDQEHEFGKLFGLPNYEVNYRPWVREVVSSLSGSRSLMGWQLGNELKARGSPRNGISSAQAYEWYLDFTRDMVDTIRSVDRNHLIFTGTQYIAETVDWEYRPEGRIAVDRLPEYRRLVQKALDARGSYTWNVWSITSYDFNPYPLDDAVSFGRAGVAVVATEYGFTRGTPTEEQQRYGADQAATVRNGLGRSWQDLDGRVQPRQWSVPELFSQGLLDGVATWGSPAPGPGAEMDADWARGITAVPDEAALWDAWRAVGAILESANKAGPVLR